MITYNSLLSLSYPFAPSSNPHGLGVGGAFVAVDVAACHRRLACYDNFSRNSPWTIIGLCVGLRCGSETKKVRRFVVVWIIANLDAVQFFKVVVISVMNPV